MSEEQAVLYLEEFRDCVERFPEQVQCVDHE